MTTTTKVFGSFKAQAANSAETGVKKDDVFKVPVDKLLEEEGFNERDYNDPEVEAQIEMFAQAYENGQYVPPLTVRIDSLTGSFFLVDGHQRTRGAKRAIARGATLEHLVCVPFRGNNVDRVFCMVNSSNGLKLKPVGVARSYLRLINMGKTVADIAKGVHQNVPHVESMLVLAEANADVHTLVDQGVVSATTAIEIVRKHGEKAGAFLAGKLEQEKAKGKTKIRPAAIKDWAPPRKMATAIYSSLAPVYASLAQQTEALALLEQPEAANGEALEGKKLWVDAKALLQLCQAFKDAEALKLKRSGESISSEDDSSNAGAPPAGD